MNKKDIYRTLCPNSIIDVDDIDDVDLSRIITNIQRLQLIKESNKVEDVSEEDKQAYDAWKLGRRKDCFNDFNDDEKAEVIAAIDMYIESFGDVDEVYMAGSYTSGSYIDTNSTDEDRATRNLCKLNSKRISDIDLMPSPFYGHKMFGRVDFNLLHQGRKILIWKEGKTV